MSMSMIMTSLDCARVREVSLSAKYLMIDYRLVFLLVYITVINILAHTIRTKIVARLPHMEKFPMATRDDLTYRHLQLLLGPIIALAGYAALLFNASTGCNASEIWFFWIGGAILTCMDLHEYVCRWPLPTPILVHHLLVFGITLCFFDLQALPAEKDAPIDWLTVMVVSNIGMCWMSDGFHIAYRTWSSLPHIEMARKVWLSVALVRVLNIGLLIAGAVRAGYGGSWLGVIVTGFMALGYAWNSLRAIVFVGLFDCGKYWESHQCKWSNSGGEDDGSDVSCAEPSARLESTTVSDEV